MPDSAGRIVVGMGPELLDEARRELPRALPGGASASDVVQETIKAALEPAARGDREGWDERQVRNHTFGIFRHKLADALRAAYRNPAPADSGAQIPDRARAPSSLAVVRERSRRVNDALEKLGPRDRRILISRTEEELTFEQIGEEFGISLQAAYTAYKRAFDNFKKVYGPDSGSA